MSKEIRRFAITHSPLSSAVWTGLEPATPCVTGRYSNQLNYHTGYFCEVLRGVCFPFASAKLRSKNGLCKYFSDFFQKKMFFLIFLSKGVCLLHKKRRTPVRNPTLCSCKPAVVYLLAVMSSTSTSKMRVEPGGIEPVALLP